MTFDIVEAFHDLSIEDFKGLSTTDDTICTLEATVTTGLERVAADEVKEKLGANCVCLIGRVFFDIETVKIPKVLKLRSIEGVSIIILMKQNAICNEDREHNFMKIYNLCEQANFHKGMKVWQSVTEKEYGNIFQAETEVKELMVQPKPSADLNGMHHSSVMKNLPENVLEKVNTYIKGVVKLGAPVMPESPPVEKLTTKNQRIESDFKFRVTCKRTGTAHNFGGSEAARQFGGAINSRFGWPVDLSNFDVEILLTLKDELAYAGIPLTKTALYDRNLAFFGRTNLKSTVCYGMLNIIKPQVGDIILDHMCGGGSIPLEGCFSYKDAFYYGGDLDEISVNRNRANYDHHIGQKASMKMDIARWDATKLPLRDQSVDLVISDLPFGHRIGSKFDNRVLYYNSLLEIARVVKTDTGKAALLTFDKNNMIKNMCKVSSLWRKISCKTINLGGLLPCIYLLKRTSLLTDTSLKPVRSKPAKRNYTLNKNDTHHTNPLEL